MKTNLKQFVQLRQQLQQERAHLQARLTELDRALGQSAPIPASSPTSTAPAPKKQFSAATIAKMRASQQARWANKGVAVKTAEPKKARRMSAAGRANIIAAQQARRAKEKGAAVKTAEPKRGRKKMSAEARARISVASKARWAKFHAQKAAKLKTGK